MSTAAVETPVAAAIAEPTVAAPTTEVPATTAEPVSESAPAATTETSAAEPVVAPEEAKHGDLTTVEATPITSGNLGAKVTPVLKLFKYSQRYFWLADEAALDEETINHYLKGDHENKHHTAAHASQTGKGLLLYAKRAEDKSHPEGIFNLAEVTDVTKQGSTEFSFKIHDKKQAFQATTSAERDGWLVAINTAVSDAAGAKDALRETDGYKDAHKKYIGAGAASAGVVGAAVVAKEAKSEDKTDAAAAEPSKARSTSRNPFKRGVSKGDKAEKGGIKEKIEVEKEKIENVIENKKEEHAEKKAEKEEAKKEEEAGAATGAAAGTAVANEKHEETKAPKKNRLSSIFAIGGKKDAPKETPAVSAEAPKVEAPVESGAPLTESVPTEAVATTETAPVAEAAPATTAEPVETPAVNGVKPERSPSPKGRFGGLFKKTPFTQSATPAAAKTEAAPAETAAATEATPAVESTEAAAPVEDATVTKPADKRRSSFQALKENLTRSFSKKEKSATPATAEDAPPVPAKDPEVSAPVATTEEAATTVPEVKAEEPVLVGEPAATVTPSVGQPSSV